MPPQPGGHSGDHGPSVFSPPSARVSPRSEPAYDLGSTRYGRYVSQVGWRTATERALYGPGGFYTRGERPAPTSVPHPPLAPVHRGSGPAGRRAPASGSSTSLGSTTVASTPVALTCSERRDLGRVAALRHAEPSPVGVHFKDVFCFFFSF